MDEDSAEVFSISSADEPRPQVPTAAPTSTGDSDDEFEWDSISRGRYFGKLHDSSDDDADDGTSRIHVRRDRVIVCDNCQQTGHIAANCKHKVCLLCGALDDHRYDRCPLMRKCDVCGVLGHLRKHCRASPIGRNGKCSTCGMRGHHPAACSLQWRFYHVAQDPQLPDYMQRTRRYCYSCASSHHWGDECGSNTARNFTSAFTVRNEPANRAQPRAYRDDGLHSSQKKARDYRDRDFGEDRDKASRDYHESDTSRARHRFSRDYRDENLRDYRNYRADGSPSARPVPAHERIEGAQNERKRKASALSSSPSPSALAPARANSMPESEGLKHENESFRPRNESAESKKETLTPANEGLAPKNETFKHEGLERKTRTFGPKDEGLRPKDESIRSKTDGSRPRNGRVTKPLEKSRRQNDTRPKWPSSLMDKIRSRLKPGSRHGRPDMDERSLKRARW